MLKKHSAADEAAHPLLLATLCPQCLKEIDPIPGLEIPTLTLAEDGRFACKNGHVYDELDSLPAEAPVQEPVISGETPPWEIPAAAENIGEQLPELEALPPKVTAETSFPEILAFPEISPGKRAIITGIQDPLSQEGPPPKAPPAATIAPEAVPPLEAPVPEIVASLPEAPVAEVIVFRTAGDTSPRELPGGDVIFSVRVSEAYVTNLRAEAEVKGMTLEEYFGACVDYWLSTGMYF